MMMTIVSRFTILRFSTDVNFARPDYSFPLVLKKKETASGRESGQSTPGGGLNGRSSTRQKDLSEADLSKADAVLSSRASCLFSLNCVYSHVWAAVNGH